MLLAFRNQAEEYSHEYWGRADLLCPPSNRRCGPQTERCLATRGLPNLRSQRIPESKQLSDRGLITAERGLHENKL